MTALKSLFLGDITVDETEISWIAQSDVSPLFEAYPRLEEFAVRGGTGLGFGRPAHENLRRLTVEAGGLDGSIVREILSGHLPALESLELWLGDSNYGNTVTPDDLAPLM